MKDSHNKYYERKNNKSNDTQINMEVKMRIKEVTVTAEASLAYQKYCASITAEEVHTKEDFNSLRNWAIEQAKAGIKELTAGVKAINTEEEEDHTEMVKVDARRIVQDTPRAVVTQPVTPQVQGKMEAKTIEDCAVGDTWYFDNIAYKLCKNKTTGDLFWAIVDKNLISDSHPKYHKQGLQ